MRGLKEISKFLSHFTYWQITLKIELFYRDVYGGVSCFYRRKYACLRRLENEKKTKYSGVTNFDAQLHRSNEL